jgi:hypothetical protein
LRRCWWSLQRQCERDRSDLIEAHGQECLCHANSTSVSGIFLRLGKLGRSSAAPLQGFAKILRFHRTSTC